MNAHAFASTFYFFPHTMQPHIKIKRACKPTHPERAAIQCKLEQTQIRTDRRAADNSGDRCTTPLKTPHFFEHAIIQHTAL